MYMKILIKSFDKRKTLTGKYGSWSATEFFVLVATYGIGGLFASWRWI